MILRAPSAGPSYSIFIKQPCRPGALHGMLLIPFGTFSVESGKLTQEIWPNISDDSVSAFSRFQPSPTCVSWIAGVEASHSIRANYGRLMRWWITTPETGGYTSRLAGDDNFEFWISTDGVEADFSPFKR
jgi:hypothetical protein